MKNIIIFLRKTEQSSAARFMQAYFEKDGLTYMLLHIKEEEMDLLYKKKKTRRMVGYPMCFDIKARIWPRSSDDIEIKLAEEQ